MEPFIRIVVLNYNSGALLSRCIESLIRLDGPSERREILVIDNGSSDGSDLAAVAEPGVSLLRNPQGNTGFSANNLGFENLTGVDYVALVNPDTHVSPNWLALLVETMERDPSLGAACPRILLDETFAEFEVSAPGRVVITAASVDGEPRGFHAWPGAEPLPGEAGTIWFAGSRATVRVAAPDSATTATLELCSTRVGRGTVAGTDVDFRTEPSEVTVSVPAQRATVLQHAGSYRTRSGNAGDIGWLEPDDARWDESSEVQGWCGASVLLRAAYLLDVGCFDESFFLYYEDADLSWRGEKQGWRYRYVPAAVTWHHQSATIGIASPLAIHHQWRNRLRMVRNNAGPVTRLIVHARAHLAIARLRLRGTRRTTGVLRTALVRRTRAKRSARSCD